MGWVYFIFLSLFWGLSFIGIRISLEGVPPFAAAGLRVLIATLVMAASAVWMRLPPPRSRPLIRRLLIMGLLNFTIPWAALFWGEQHISPALASIFNSTVPIFVLLLSWFFVADERPTTLKATGVAIGFGGIVWIFAPAIRGQALDHMVIWGSLAGLLMAVSYAGAAVMTKAILPLVDVRWAVAVQGLIGAPLLFLMSLVWEPKAWIGNLPNHLPSVGSLLYLGLISTALAWVFWFRLVRKWGVLATSTVTYAIPSVAILVDWLYFGKWPARNQLEGAALIVCGLALIHVARVRQTSVVEVREAKVA